MLKWLNKAKIPTALAFAYWLFINIVYVDGYFYGKSSFFITALFKGTALIAAIAFANFIAAQIRRAKTDQLHRTFLKRSLLYFGIMFVFLLLVWPGIYVHDDIGVFSKATALIADPWQHFLSSVHMITSIMLLPIASAPVFFQCLFASLIVGYISTYTPTVLTENAKKQKKLTIALFIIFLLPPVILHVLCGYRMSIYQYFEAFILLYFYIHYKKAEKISTPKMIYLLFLMILLCSWRSEGIYYLIGLPVLFYIIRKPLFTMRQIAIYSLILIVATLGISKVNNKLIGSNSYSLGALMVPISGIIDGAIESNDEETLAIYDKAFNIQCIKDNNIAKMPERIFWDCFRSDNDEVISLTTKTTIKLAPKYLGSIIEKYSDVLCDAFLGIKCGAYNTGQTGATYIADWSNYYFSTQAEEEGFAFFERVDIPFNRPISLRVHRAMVNFLTGRMPNAEFDPQYLLKKYDSPSYAIPVYYQLFYSLIIPTVAIIAAFVIAIRRKKWVLLWIIVLIAGRAVIVSATGMASYLMYFMPFYISSLVFFIVVIAEENISKVKKVAKNAKVAKKSRK